MVPENAFVPFLHHAAHEPRRGNLYLLHRAIEDVYLLDRDFDDADAHFAGEASDVDALIIEPE